MSQIVAIHSFHEGANKSRVTANLATVVALRGKRVGVVDTTYDTTPEAVKQAGGRVFHITSSIKAGKISRILREAHDVELLNDGFRKVIQALNLDILFIDTRPGFDEEALRPIAISDVVVIVLRPDSEDFQGTSVIVEVARKLDVPRICLVLNQVRPTFDFDVVKKQVEEAYHCPVAAILPLSENMVHPGSAAAPRLEDSQPPFPQSIKDLADFVLAE